jgi:hypothetical protein
MCYNFGIATVLDQSATYVTVPRCTVCSFNFNPSLVSM